MYRGGSLGSSRLSLLSLTAAFVALCAADAAFALDESDVFDDDVLAATCTPPSAPECPPVPDAGGPPGPDAGSDTVEAVLAEANATVRLRPWKVQQGGLFEVEVVGEGLRSGAATFSGETLPLFQVTPGRFRGYGGVPLEARPGMALVHVAVVGPDAKPRSGSLALEVVERQVESTTIRVASRFTQPSARQVAQMKEDRKAIAAAYQVPFGPPLFQAGFADPLGHERGSRFGERRVFNGKTKSRHWGLDIDGDAGEEVYASNTGVVVLARPCFMSGLTVIVSHGAGLFTGYFHFSKFAVKAGQRVSRGDVLGYVGSTGRSTGPHLHFAAKLHRGLIDPEALMAFDFAPLQPAAAPSPDAGSAP